MDKSTAVDITIMGALIRENDANLSSQDWNKIVKKLTVSHTFIVPKTNNRIVKSLSAAKKIIIVGDEEISYLLFAANINLLNLGFRPVYKNNVSAGNIILDSALMPGIQLYENQKLAVDYLIENIYTPQNVSQGHASCVFVMSTGLGKTFIGGSLIGKFKRKTLIVVPRMPCVEEWTKMLAASYPSLRVGQYHSRAPKSDGEVVIMTINSALLDEFKWSSRSKMSWTTYFKKFGFVIFDEVHNYSTATREEVFWRTNFGRRLGLTATPDERTDKMERILEHHLGPIVRADKIANFTTNVITWTGRVRAINYMGPPQYARRLANKNNLVSVAKMCRQFIEDPYRMALIIDEVRALCEAAHNVYIFTNRRDNVERLLEILQTAKVTASAPECSKLMGGSTSEDKRHAECTSRVVIMTYSYGIEGISIAKMDAIVLATPRKKGMNQILGRILRCNGDVSIERCIIDIIDSNTSLKSQFYERKKIYLEKGFTIDRIRVDHSRAPTIQ